MDEVIYVRSFPATSESCKESPILFSLCDELPDDTDDVDVVADTESADVTEPVFGAYLKTFRLPLEEENEGRRFRHLLHGIDASKEHGLFEHIREGDELISINEKDVTSWSHDAVLKTILDLEEEITFKFYRRTETYNGLTKDTNEEYITIVFVISDLSSDDKGRTGDITSHIVKVCVNIQERITDSQPLVVLKCEGTEEMKIRHGAQIHNFLMVKKNKPVLEKIMSKDDSEAYTFKVYNFTINDEKQKKLRSVIAIQCKQTKQFLMCTSGKKLSLVKDDGITKEMTNISHNSPYLFFITQSPDGDGTSYLESVTYPGKFLEYEVIDGLCLKKLKTPPYSPAFHSSDCIRRNFTFTLL